jgi:predicted dienelactone hydrolase
MISRRQGLDRANLKATRSMTAAASPMVRIAIVTCLAAQTMRPEFSSSAKGERPALAGVVWYPCALLDQEVRPHGLKVPGVRNCLVGAAKIPQIVISHGRTGWYGGHHDTAEVLDGAFVVAAINHPGENAFDSSRVDELSLAPERPADTKRLIVLHRGEFWVGTRTDHPISRHAIDALLY